MNYLPIKSINALVLLGITAFHLTQTTIGQVPETPSAVEAMVVENVSLAPIEWPSWRGPADAGSISGDNFPAALDPQEAIWKTELSGKGCSTPIVVAQKIFVTVPADGNDSLACFDSAGKELWQSFFNQEDAGKHRNGSGSNASPVSDGSAVFAYFKSGTLCAVDLDGTKRWQKDLTKLYGKTKLYWDHGTSPVLTEDNVIMARMHGGDSWVAAFNKKDGREVWKVARNFETPREGDHGYATPVVMNVDGKESVLVYGAEQLTLHDAASGECYWSCGNFNPDKTELWPTIATPVVIDGIAVVAAGRNDRRLPLLYGVSLKGSGDVTKTGHVWKRDDTGTFVPSPATLDGKVYLLRDLGEFECLDPATGKTQWAGKFPKHRKKYYSSPLIAGGKLYAIREDGVMFVADISNGRLNVLSQHKLGESVIGSPIPMGDNILVRSEKHLYCF